LAFILRERILPNIKFQSKNLAAPLFAALRFLAADHSPKRFSRKKAQKTQHSGRQSEKLD
jgi:hypothetical protein